MIYIILAILALSIFFLIIGSKFKLKNTFKSGVFLFIATMGLTFYLPLSARGDRAEIQRITNEERQADSKNDIDIGSITIDVKNRNLKKLYATADGLEKDKKYTLVANIYKSDGKGNKTYKITECVGFFKATTNEKFKIYYEIDTNQTGSDIFIEHNIRPN